MSVFDTFAKRQAVKEFSNRNVSDSDIKKLIEAANASPVGNGAYDKYHLTLVTDKELMDKVNKTIGPDAKPLHNAPCWFIVSTSEENFVTYSSAAIVTHQIALASYDLGLGACHVWSVMHNIAEDEEIFNELGIPEGFTPVASVVVGYSPEELEERPLVTDRINLNKVR